VVWCQTYIRIEEASWVEHQGTDVWGVVESAPLTELMEMTIAVKQRNIDQLENILLQTSDPSNPSYGKHLNQSQIDAILAPLPRSIRVVLAWLSSHHVSPKWTSANSDFITVIVTVEQAQLMLQTTYDVFEHRSSKIQAVRCHHYSVPAEVALAIDFVAPTIRLPAIQTARVRRSSSTFVDGSGKAIDFFNTPKILRELYQVGATTRSKASSNLQAVASFLEQYYSPNDLQEFFFIFQNTSIGHTVLADMGPNKPDDPGTEASLDVQYIMSVGAWVPTWVYYTVGRSPTNPNNEPFLAWLVNVTSSTIVPKVISVSYGEDEKSVGFAYAKRVNTEFMKLGTLGISVMFASGDSGAGGNCTEAGRMSPNFPADSPYVTAVGGLVGGTPGHTPTGEVTDSISGGGFSDYWPTPSWQAAATKAYMSQSGLPPTQYWNQSGRGYPDVAAQSEMFTVVQFGFPLIGVGGTSCATPTFSGVISLLNDLRLQAGKSSLGFLNPLIYQIAPANANVFNDVIEGENMGCGHGGFPAKKGWDAATGWGSPNYALLSKVVTSLP